jgi:hypothetical protein
MRGVSASRHPISVSLEGPGEGKISAGKLVMKLVSGLSVLGRARECSVVLHPFFHSSRDTLPYCHRITGHMACATLDRFRWLSLSCNMWSTHHDGDRPGRWSPARPRRWATTAGRVTPSGRVLRQVVSPPPSTVGILAGRSCRETPGPESIAEPQYYHYHLAWPRVVSPPS